MAWSLLQSHPSFLLLSFTKLNWTYSLGIFSIFCDLFPQIGCLRAAILLHLSLLFGVMRAPLKFFDKTPTGRILARFSKDIDVLDTGLPEQISTVVYCLYEVISLTILTGQDHLELNGRS